MKIVISPNPFRDKRFEYTQKIAQALKEKGIETAIYLPFGVDRNIDCPPSLNFSSEEEALHNCDVFLCLGGDGTILHASKIASERNVPILGINIGSLGFMAELENSELSLLNKLQSGDYCTEERMMLDVQVISGGKKIFSDCALNDAVITKGAVARVVQTDVVCDDMPVLSLCGDGVIIATPTGSTGYSLSAGGPIIEPTAKNILITPICAHSPSARCFIMNDTREVQVLVEKGGRRNAFLSVDGGRAFRLEAMDIVCTKRSSRVTKLIRLKDNSFFDTINKKFHDR